MNDQIAFVGDVHGNSSALRGLWSALSKSRAKHTVFLGDYINKGTQSADVISFLGKLAADGHATLLRGNHESALLEALETHNLAPFLKMGGAMTIRSYMGTPVGPDVVTEFIAAMPSEHLSFLHSLSDAYETEEVIARHMPWDVQPKKYAITAHRLVGAVPLIGPNAARIDTGCGDSNGRLTALFWPGLDYVQVDERGELVDSTRHG